MLLDANWCCLMLIDICWQIFTLWISEFIWIQNIKTNKYMNIFLSECICVLKIDTNEYPNIFVSNSCYEWISEYICIQQIDTNKYPNIYLYQKYLNIFVTLCYVASKWIDKLRPNLSSLLSWHNYIMPRSPVCVTEEDALSGILCKSSSPVICYPPLMMICQVKRVCDNGKLCVGIRIKSWSRLCVKICIKPPPPLARVICILM